jgi:hypothetical protein
MAQTEIDWKLVSRSGSQGDINAFSHNPLLAGLWVLSVSKNHRDVPYLSYSEIENVLQEDLDIAIDALMLKRAFATAGNKVIRRSSDGSLKISGLGEKHLESLNRDAPLEVIYVEPKTPRTAKKNLEGLISSIKKSDLLINDPYYGIGALDIIETFLKYHKSVRFMTVKVGGGEKPDTVAQRIKDMKTEFGGSFDIRRGDPSELHDRYIIASDTFFLVGQGIKDLGNKESFLLAIDDRVGREIRLSLTSNFESRWKRATPI